ncbi:hypothetical protein [Duncaniella muris]|uniref:hypothetical protein n=1 Tax=Duncaniella muris TaxID=2094150 RepID=UPI000F485B8B|nr:hypothetical protein [Duncaniella muris]ROT16540.1 hypothetical protein EEL51_13675 [Muribaculaceae bacterium Isolate-110 (HZI)]
MAVKPEEILARGQGPVQTTWADKDTQPTVPVKPVQPQSPVATDEPTGVESVSYDTTTAQGEPNNPKNAREVVERGVVNVANPQTATDTEQVTPVDEQQTAPEGKKLSYVEMFQQMSPYKPPTPEELEKERKKQKREVIFAAIGEGISAMSNLYFTTQYAPNAFDPSKGMAATTKARFDQLKKDREDNQRQYMEGFMRAMRLDAEDADKDRTWRHTLERERISDERYAEKTARDKALADLNEKLKGHQITKAEYEAEIARIKASHAEEDAGLHTEGLRAGIKQKKAAASASNASASASNARADYYRSGGSGRKGPKLQLEEDEPMRFDNDTDYDRTVMRLAPDYNVPTTNTEVTERYEHGTKKGQPKKQRTVQRPVKDIAADIEREAAKRKASKSTKGKGYGNNNGSNGKGKGYGQKE